MSNARIASFASGAYVSGRLSQMFVDRVALPTGLRMVQLCHGWPSTPGEFAYLQTLIATLVESGRYLPFAADQGGSNLFGGTGVATDIEAANTWVAARYGCRTDKFAMIGYSMGFLNAAQEVYANPSKIPVLVGVAPLTNGANVYTDAGAGQLRTDMDASPGASGAWANVNAARSPSSQTAAFAGIHLECWQGSADTTVRPADTAAFCTAVGGTNHAVAGTHGSVWTNVVAADVLAALDAGNWS